MKRKGIWERNVGGAPCERILALTNIAFHKRLRAACGRCRSGETASGTRASWRPGVRGRRSRDTPWSRSSWTWCRESFGCWGGWTGPWWQSLPGTVSGSRGPCRPWTSPRQDRTGSPTRTEPRSAPNKFESKRTLKHNNFSQNSHWERQSSSVSKCGLVCVALIPGEALLISTPFRGKLLFKF